MKLILWRYPSWLWIELFPLLVFSVLAISYATQRRRMKRFGNLRVLGLASNIALPLLRSLLLVSGVACVAAIPADPYQPGVESISGESTVGIYCDLQPAPVPEMPDERKWEDLCDGVEMLVALSPSARFSVYGPGDPLTTLVPKTTDTEGMLLMLNGSPPASAGGDGGSLTRGVAALLSGQKDELRKIVVLSTRPPEELAGVWSSLPPAGALMFVRIAAEGAPTEYGSAGDAGTLVWSRQGGSLWSFLNSDRNSGRRHLPPGQLLSPTQYLALGGFIMIAAEFLIPLRVRTRIRG
jgi:hypothetical protein